MNSFIPTLEETLEEQDNLEQLCQDREIETTEIFQPNAYYGMDFIIKKYANIPTEKPLKTIFPHGINISNKIWGVEKKALLSIIYNYSPHRYSLYKKETNKIILWSAAPYVYLSELLKFNQKQERKGTIFFPAHSSHHVTATMDYENLVTDLEGLDEKYKPITICIYWRDYNLKKHKVFQKRGFKIVSAGHMYDPLFLFRLYQLCSAHQYASSNKVGGSSLFYSVKAGCTYFILNNKKIKYEATKDVLKRDCLGIDYHQPTYNLILQLFNEPLDEISVEQNRFVDELLGVKSMKTPNGLRKELLFADTLDKFGLAKHPQTKQYHYRLPNLIPRKLLKNIKNKFT